MDESCLFTSTLDEALEVYIFSVIIHYGNGILSSCPAPAME